MSERVVSTPDSPVCIHTAQIIDCCLDKDCIEDLRVFLTESSQSALDTATGAKARCAELMYTNVEVSPLAYKCGYYAIDLTFYYRIVGDALMGGLRPTTITGLAIFAKRVVLFGGTTRAKVFHSGADFPLCEEMLLPPVPQAYVEALDPMILSAKLRSNRECCCCETDVVDIPVPIAECFGEPLSMTGTQRFYVTVGQFSTVRLERDSQISVCAGDYCAPTRECCEEECCEEDPCELFSHIDFPMNAFFSNGRDNGCQPEHCHCE